MRSRDYMLAVLIAFALNYQFHMRPLGQARKAMESDALEGFRHAFISHAFVGGKLIAPRKATRVFKDATKEPVQSRTLNIVAEQLDSEDQAQFVVEHEVVMATGTVHSRTVHMTFVRDGYQWTCDRFQVRDGSSFSTGNCVNRWSRAFK